MAFPQKKILLLLFIIGISNFIFASLKNVKFQGDTINRVNKKGEKQGYWILLGKNKKEPRFSHYGRNQKIEEGYYLNNQKQRLWKSWYNTNELQSEITYENGIPEGPAKFYYENGKVREEGIYERDHWVGEYHVFDKEGNLTVRKSVSVQDLKSAYLLISGEVKKLNKELDSVRITVEKFGFETAVFFSAKDGTFSFRLPLNEEYIIYFNKQGFHHQSINVNTNVDSEMDTTVYSIRGYKVNLSDNLASSAFSELVNVTLNKPIGKIRFDEKKKQFIAERLIRKPEEVADDLGQSVRQMIQQTAQLENEKSNAEAEKKMKERELELFKEEEEAKDAAELMKKESALTKLENEQKIQKYKYEQIQEELGLQREKQKNQALSEEDKSKTLELINKESELQKQKQEELLKDKEITIQKRENDVKQRELKQEQLYILYISLGLGLVLSFAFLLYRNYLNKSKANKQLHLANTEILRHKMELEEKNKDITDSITYAERIQRAILPSTDLIRQNLPQCFILFKPKDIVSGDFYFSHKMLSKEGRNGEELIFIAACDCTGHGVPGAFMSMIGLNKLNDAVVQSTDPGEILALVNKGIKKALNQSFIGKNPEEGTAKARDGMDMALVSLEFSAPGNSPACKLKYAGANRPLWLIRSGNLIEFKPTKTGIGGHTDDLQEFKTHEIQLNQGETIYIFTDGFADQFGGEYGKKLMTKTFKETLLSIAGKGMPEQRDYLDTYIENWKNQQKLGKHYEQVDDICVIGVRI